MTTPDPRNPSDLSSDHARELLDHAQRTAATTRVGASWTAVAFLMAIGAGSSAALIGIWLAGPELLGLPMSMFFLWMAIGSAFHFRFAHAAKRGFTRRWLVTIGLWALAWIVSVFTTSTGAIGDNIWFVTAMALLLTLITTIGAWREASA